MLEQHSYSQITCDNKGCGANERRSGLKNMRDIAGFIGWTEADGQDFCPRCSRERKQADPGGEG